MAASCLTVRNLQAWYTPQQMVLSGLSMELKKHEAVGLIGWNGAGKTTLIRALSGLLKNCRADEIRSGSRPVDFRDEAFKLYRYSVFDEDHSFAYFTFREYFSYACRAYGKTGKDMPDPGEIVEGFHFAEYQDVWMKALSTGNRKKAFLITGFALKPELLLLDEPVNGLDFQSTEYLYRLIRSYKAYGTVLFASHILESITLTSDRVLVLEHGRIGRTFEKEQIDADEIREVLRDENDV